MPTIFLSAKLSLVFVSSMRDVNITIPITMCLFMIMIVAALVTGARAYGERGAGFTWKQFHTFHVPIRNQNRDPCNRFNQKFFQKFTVRVKTYAWLVHCMTSAQDTYLFSWKWHHYVDASPEPDCQSHALSGV